MDFNLDETQQDLRKLAAEVLARDGEPGERLRQAGLMSVCVPEAAGGAGLGPVEMAVVLREVGARAAAAGALPTLVGTLALARYGTPDQQRRYGGGPDDGGGGRLAVALREPGRTPADPPLTTARQTAGGWTLTGRKASVPYPGPPLLVTADAGLFVVDQPPDDQPSAGQPSVDQASGGQASGEQGPGKRSSGGQGSGAGVTARPEYTSTGEPAATIVLDGAPAEWVGGGEAVDGVRWLFMAAVAAQASGVLAGALELTTAHVKARRQFGRALAEFQAVTMQIADVYIAGRALDVAMWSAVWRLGEGLPADQDVALAAYHVSEAVKALYTCQHLHGGLGLDVTYPLHRYFAQARHLSQLLGGADAQLDLIGALV
ncbi:acyl-CoA dehydrogenase family protein [Nonomuraea sp. B12E4]|uniref:acyl-CoA dehydrogenase family protein n=1 Tax=Nonomuraea sp. B12E4 TaxID=3153564 RepID=UPI00325D2048